VVAELSEANLVFSNEDLSLSVALFQGEHAIWCIYSWYSFFLFSYFDYDLQATPGYQTEEQERRQFKLIQLRRRGKGPPKKGADKKRKK
jgi:hypothetical protein